MQYRKTFDPGSAKVFTDQRKIGAGGGRDRSIYVYKDEIVLAVNVALATERPLLIRGPSGCGKSTLARNVAISLGWRYYEQVITSRTQARDLLWKVDLLRRLQDAQAKALAPDFAAYVVPELLWWAFDRQTASAQADRTQKGKGLAHEPGDYLSDAPAVVLLDEIDKADPDLPNNLLVPLGSLTFTVEETGETVSASKSPLVFLTTNEERDLPVAFVRRCVELKLPSPSPEQLVSIGRIHFGSDAGALLESVAALIGSVTAEGGAANPPSTAEYLDTVRACLDLGVTPGSDLFVALSKVTVWKHGRMPTQGRVS